MAEDKAKNTSKGKTTKAADGAESARQQTARPEASKGLQPVAELATAAGVKEWELAGLMRAAGWAEGKECTPEVFARALAAFRARPQGGGRIVIG
jgi:hypothetical protein